MKNRLTWLVLLGMAAVIGLYSCSKASNNTGPSVLSPATAASSTATLGTLTLSIQCGGSNPSCI